MQSAKSNAISHVPGTNVAERHLISISSTPVPMESVLGFRYVISGTGLGQAGTTAVRSLVLR